MRGSFNRVVRGLLVLSVVLALGVPADARTNHGGETWIGERGPIGEVMKVIKAIKRAVRSFGDGLTDPKP